MEPASQVPSNLQAVAVALVVSLETKFYIGLVVAYAQEECPVMCSDSDLHPALGLLLW